MSGLAESSPFTSLLLMPVAMFRNPRGNLEARRTVGLRGLLGGESRRASAGGHQRGGAEAMKETSGRERRFIEAGEVANVRQAVGGDDESSGRFAAERAAAPGRGIARLLAPFFPPEKVGPMAQ